MKKYLISEELIHELGKYLSGRPLGEVLLLWNKLDIELSSNIEAVKKAITQEEIESREEEDECSCEVEDNGCGLCE